MMRAMQAKPLLTSWLREIASIPWRDAAITLRERFREDRLGLTASSLTFTTTIALVPLITVALAVFTAFPMFAKFQDVLQKWLIESLVPDNIARQVLGYLNQFAGKASRLGVAGLTILLGTALALIFTIDRTLNSIWRVKKRRPFGQRVLIYWAAVTLGPLLLGASLSITSYAVTASKGVVGGLPGGLTLLLDSLQFVLVAAGTAAMFHYVPNTMCAGAMLGWRLVCVNRHGAGAQGAGALFEQGAYLLGGIWRLRHSPDFADLDLYRLGHCAVGCRAYCLPAKPAGWSATPQVGPWLAVSAGAGSAAHAGCC